MTSDTTHIDQAVPKSVREQVEQAKKSQILGWEYPYKVKMKREEYEEAKLELQIELLKMENWVKAKGKKIVVLFEGRDAGGKGGTIKRFMEHMNPRGARVVALDKPTDKERGQWYFQRYIQHLPTTGEIVFFDRSWYNRAVVEPVMGFCTDKENQQFLEQAPLFEQMLIESGIILFKYWFSVSRPEQFRRFKSREIDRLKQWKLSPVDEQSLSRWDDYTKAIDTMFEYTDTKMAPWIVVRSDDKKRARLNCMLHLLHTMPYSKKNEKLVCPPDPGILGPAKKMYKSFVEKHPEIKDAG
jgi:polyphosphate kinase 2